MQKFQRLARIALNRLIRLAESKIIAILGARQVGKTTLLLDFASTWKDKLVKYLGDKLEDAVLWRGKFSEVKNNLEVNLGVPLEELTCTASDFAGIKSLIGASPNKVKAGFVVSRQPYAEKFGGNLFAVPWWYFCL